MNLKLIPKRPNFQIYPQEGSQTLYIIGDLSNGKMSESSCCHNSRQGNRIFMNFFRYVKCLTTNLTVSNLINGGGQSS